MSGLCPHGHQSDADRTVFGQCLDSVRTLDPTRPDPTRDPFRRRVRAVQQVDQERKYSPSPTRGLLSVYANAPTLERTIWDLLCGGLHALSANDYGRPWPYPNRRRVAELLAEHDEDHCLKAAREAREIVQSQDRAPNITALFEKKLRELAEARRVVRESLGAMA